ncbi:MAG: hypothetical protein K6L76_08720 [Agarilytica sp.]
MKNILIAGTLFLVSVSAYSESNKAVYKRLYQNSVMTDSRVNDDPKNAKKLMRCHMKALAVFPVAMQKTAFQVAGTTQNYDEAKNAFFQMSVDEMAISEHRKAEMNALIAQSNAVGEACMADKVTR